MRILVSIFALLLLAYTACKPLDKTTATEQKAVFPDDWIGHYQGDLELVNATRGKTMTLPMTLIISPTDTANRWRWYSKAIYQGQEIIKDYALYRTDSMPPNHFIMDENNGIYLDRILLDGGFYDYFEVGNLGLYGITKKVGADIHFEIASFSLQSKRYSTYEGEGSKIDTITSYKVINTQKVLLKRVKDNEATPKVQK
jgi:hypothetical protein